MSTHGRLTVAEILSTRACAILGSRYSSMYRIKVSRIEISRYRCYARLVFRFNLGIRLEHPDTLQQLVGTLGFFLVQDVERKADMHQNVIARFGLRHEVEKDRALDAAELDRAHTVIADQLRLHQFSRYSVSHKTRFSFLVSRWGRSIGQATEPETRNEKPETSF